MRGTYNAGFEGEDADPEDNNQMERSNRLKMNGQDEPKENEKTQENKMGYGFLYLRNEMNKLFKNHPIAIKKGILIIINIVVITYVIGATVYWLKKPNTEGIDYCNGIGMVYILFGIVYFGLFYFQIVKPYFGRKFHSKILRPIGVMLSVLWNKLIFRVLVYGIIIASIVIFLIFDTAQEWERLISVSGIFVLMLFGYIFSAHPEHVNWRPVLLGLGLQFVFALLTVRWPFGRQVLDCVGSKVSTFLSYGDAGTSMVYGNELVIKLQVFAFKILPVIYFFSFCISILYYYGAMQWIVLKLGWLLQVLLGTTACESVNCAASIFLGPTESAIMFKPYISVLTRSELHAFLTAGLATIAGAVMAAYITFGIDAAHLITASIMSAPAALCYSKLFYSETEKSLTTASDIKITKGEGANMLDAVAKGVNDAISIVLGIVANLIAFISLIAFLNGLISWFGAKVGAEYLTFEWILGKCFMPLAFVMGVPWQDCGEVGILIGLKTVVNEFVAYERLGEFIKQGALTARSQTIATYALCGFSNPGSIGIMIGCFSAVAPERRNHITELAVRSLIAWICSMFLNCLCSSCFIAGALIDTTNTASNMNTTNVLPNTTFSSNYYNK